MSDEQQAAIKAQPKSEIEDELDDEPGEFAEISVKDESDEEKEIAVEVADQISSDDQSFKSVVSEEVVLSQSDRDREQDEEEQKREDN